MKIRPSAVGTRDDELTSPASRNPAALIELLDSRRPGKVPSIRTHLGQALSAHRIAGLNRASSVFAQIRTPCLYIWHRETRVDYMQTGGSREALLRPGRREAASRSVAAECRCGIRRWPRVSLVMPARHDLPKLLAREGELRSKMGIMLDASDINVYDLVGVAATARRATPTSWWLGGGKNHYSATWPSSSSARTKRLSSRRTALVLEHPRRLSRWTPASEDCRYRQPQLERRPRRRRHLPDAWDAPTSSTWTCAASMEIAKELKLARSRSARPLASACVEILTRHRWTEPARDTG